MAAGTVLQRVELNAFLNFSSLFKMNYLMATCGQAENGKTVIL
jgi:hypothetical protein